MKYCIRPLFHVVVPLTDIEMRNEPIGLQPSASDAETAEQRPDF